MDLEKHNFFNVDGWDPYAEKPKYPSVDDMKKFITSHFRYWCGNSWNRSTSYANNVKLDNLGLDYDNVPYCNALDFLYAEHPEYDWELSELMHDFRSHYHYDVGFNGRSGGYLVLYEMTYDPKNHKWSTYPLRSIDEDVKSEIDDWSTDEIKQKFLLLKAFDTLCDDIRALFISFVKKSKVRTITFLKPTEQQISLNLDNEDEEDIENLSIIMDSEVPPYDIIVRQDIASDIYLASVPELAISDIEGNTLEQSVMYAEKAILEYIDTHPDAPQPAKS